MHAPSLFPRPPHLFTAEMLFSTVINIKTAPVLMHLADLSCKSPWVGCIRRKSPRQIKNMQIPPLWLKKEDELAIFKVAFLKSHNEGTNVILHIVPLKWIPFACFKAFLLHAIPLSGSVYTGSIVHCIQCLESIYVGNIWAFFLFHFSDKD